VRLSVRKDVPKNPKNQKKSKKIQENPKKIKAK